MTGKQLRWVGFFIIIFSFFFLGNDSLTLLTGLLQLVGIIMLLTGGLIAGWFKKENIEAYRSIKGNCPHCNKHIGYVVSKCPYCTADL
jgi:amino acid permease